MTDLDRLRKEYESVPKSSYDPIYSPPVFAYIAALEAEVERLNWMLREASGYDWEDVTYDEMMANLAASYDERDDER